MAHVPDGLLTVSPAGALASMNPAAERIFGVPAAEAVGRSAEQFLPPGFASSVGQGPLECEARRADGSLLQLEVAVAEVKDTDCHLVVTVRDVTDRRRLEAEVQRTQKMDTVGMLAGGVAHDFNNVLTGIQSAAAMARLELPRGHAAEGDLAEIERQCQRAAALVRQLLAFARKQPLARRTLSVNEIVLDVESLLRRVIGENVRFAVELQADVWSISGDSAQLEQVLMNLCINARDAMPEGGRLSVRTGNVIADSDLAARARNRDRVLIEWRMRPGGGRGRGVTALFAGDSGTGKTMSAEVIAGELGLDLYTVNLATVVDKYVGETEKNLERIFAAESASTNADRGTARAAPKSRIATRATAVR